MKKSLKLKLNKIVVLFTAFAFFCASAVMFFSLIKRTTQYDYYIYNATQVYNVDKNIIKGIISAESNFNSKAVSNKGAIGLMQIMPSTAIFISSLIGKNMETNLFDAKTNIFYGTTYFAYLLDKFNNLDCALAAYNAGEGNVKEWLNNKKYSQDGVHLKTTPFEETNKYLKKVKLRIKAFKFLNKFNA